MSDQTREEVLRNAAELILTQQRNHPVDPQKIDQAMQELLRLNVSSAELDHMIAQISPQGLAAVSGTSVRGNGDALPQGVSSSHASGFWGDKALGDDAATFRPAGRRRLNVHQESVGRPLTRDIWKMAGLVALAVILSVAASLATTTYLSDRSAGTAGAEPDLADEIASLKTRVAGQDKAIAVLAQPTGSLAPATQPVAIPLAVHIQASAGIPAGQTELFTITASIFDQMGQPAKDGLPVAFSSSPAGRGSFQRHGPVLVKDGVAQAVFAANGTGDVIITALLDKGPSSVIAIHPNLQGAQRSPGATASPGSQGGQPATTGTPLPGSTSAISVTSTATISTTLPAGKPGHVTTICHLFADPKEDYSNLVIFQLPQGSPIYILDQHVANLQEVAITIWVSEQYITIANSGWTLTNEVNGVPVFVGSGRADPRNTGVQRLFNPGAAGRAVYYMTRDSSTGDYQVRIEGWMKDGTWAADSTTG